MSEYVQSSAHWLPCEYAALRAVIAAGGDDYDVSVKLKRSPEACRRKRHQLGMFRTRVIPRKRCEEMDNRLREMNDLTLLDAARMLGVSTRTVWTWRKRLGLGGRRKRYVPPRRATREECLIVGRGLIDGVPPRLILRSLPGHSRGSLAGMIYRHGEKLMAMARAQSACGQPNGGEHGTR